MTLSTLERDALPASAFAVPELRALPMHDRAHVRLAWQAVGRTEGLSPSQRDRARQRIRQQARRLGVDTDGWKHESAGPAPGLELAELDLPAGDPAGDPELDLPESLEEVAATLARAREYFRDQKGRFQAKYGSDWRSHLWGRIRTLFGVEPTQVHEAACPLREIAVVVGGGKTSVLQVIGAGLMARGVGAGLDDPDGEAGPLGAASDPSVVSGAVIVRQVREDEEPALSECGSCQESAGCEHTKKGAKKLKSLNELPCRTVLRRVNEASGDRAPAWWRNRRSITPKESADLRVAKKQLGCSVVYCEGKGYAAHTHRARSKFYERPGDIPVSVLRFISSTG